MVITGEKAKHETRGLAHEAISDTVALDPSTTLRLRAAGGAGAEGGSGGRGQDGGDGVDGEDADHFTGQRATKGTDGGNGGPGGAATNGGNAGPGGQIVIIVPEIDMDTLMLVDETDVSGNSGAPAGTPGAGGFAGSGGSGGDSDEWQTEGATTTTTNEDGSTSEETEMIDHSMPGASDGANGWPGMDNPIPVYDGQDSHAGDVTYRVEGHAREYKSIYAIKIVPGFTMTGSHNGVHTGADGDFFEPGETITITNLRIRNTGGMPTPKFQKVRLFVGDNQLYVRSNDEELTVDRVLQPGEEYSFGDQAITFHLAEKKRDVAGPLRIVDSAHPEAYLERVRRIFPESGDDAALPFVVSYPIKITALQHMRSIKPGESTKVIFKVENISNQTLGSGFEHANLRYARTDFQRVGGELNQNHVVFSERLDDGAVPPERGISRLLENLPPKASKIFETYIGISPSAKKWDDVAVRPYLVLESILNNPEQKVIQFEDFFIRIGQDFKYTKDADVLFVANHRLNARVLTAIEALAATKHLKLDVWDFSRVGFFDFSHRIEDYGPIFEAYREKTIMIMGNTIDTPGGDVHAHRLLNPDDIIAAARRYGIKIVVLDASEDREKTVTRMTEPSPLLNPADPMQRRDYPSLKAYAREIQKNTNEVQQEIGDETSFLGTWQVNVRQTYAWPWTEPTVDRLFKVGVDALKTTESFNPESQTYADLNFSSEYLGRKFLVFPHYALGSVNLRRSVDDAKTSVVAIRVPAAQLENADYFLGEEFSTAFDLGLNFRTKLKLVNEIMLGEYERAMGTEEMPEGFEHLRALAPLEYARILVHTILLDLLNEQEQIRPLTTQTDIPKAKLFDKLDLLKKLTQGTYDQYDLKPDTASGRIFIDFILAMRFYNRGITTWADRVGGFWPLRSDRLWRFGVKERNVEVSEVTRDMLDAFVGKIFGDAAAARVQIEAELKGVRQTAAKEKVTRDALIEFLDPKHLNDVAIRDGQVGRKLVDRVRDADAQSRLIERQRDRDRTSAQIKAAVQLEEETLLLKTPECDRLLKQLPTTPAEPLVKDEAHEPATVIIKTRTGIPKVPVRR